MKRSALAVLFLTVFIDLLGFGIVLPLLPRYAEDYLAGDVTIGLLMASFSFMQLLFAPFWGRLSDRYGRRPILMVGLFGSILSYALFGLARSVTLLFVSRIAAGIFGATIGTAQAYIADVTGSKDRGKQMALIGAAFGLGFTFGPALGGLAHHHLGRAAPGFLAAGFSLVAFLMAWRTLPEPERHEKRGPHVRFDATALRHAFATRTIPLILALQIVATLAFASFEGTLARFTDRKWGYNPAENGLIFTYVGFCLLLSQGFLVRRFMPRVGELNFTVAGTILLAMGFVGVALAPGTVAALATLPVVVTGFSMITPSLASLLSLRSPRSMQGEILGIGQSGLSLARILGPFAGNVLFLTSPEAPYWFAAGVMGFAFLGAIVLRRAPAPPVAS